MSRCPGKRTNIVSGGAGGEAYLPRQAQSLEKIRRSSTRPAIHLQRSLCCLDSLGPSHVLWLLALEQAADKPSAPPMADEGPRRDSQPRDKKRKWADRDRRNKARGGGLQHGSRPNKKRNMGRTEHQ